ncbi:MAG TPA: hypothetical protein VNG73_10140, partial [Gemmatimonadaceae bacterium]|nr:hypothetical protein [Gemmatimonadaceae bacterium]
SQGAPPSAPAGPSAPDAPSAPSAPAAPAANAPKPGVATLSRELADFLVELSITLNKHAIYPESHPLLHGAVDGVANRLGTLFVGDRESLSIGVARRQLIIEGVATDPLNAVLKELAMRLHAHHIGAVKFIRGIGREELGNALAALAVDPIRSQTPIGLDIERVGELWPHVRFFPLTYDRLQLIEDDPDDERSTDHMAAGRATQLWIGLARAALVSDTSGPAEKRREDHDDDSALEPATVARAIDEHQREEAYDQVIVGYLLQIGEELKTAEGPEAAGLQKRVSRLVGSLKESTLERLLEMGGDKAQRRRFLLDASQGITVEAVIDLVKAASAAEGQTVSHSMLRMLSKLAHHPSADGPRARTDPTIRDVMRRLVDDWSLDDPNPEAYRQALESMSSSRKPATKASNDAIPTDIEPERMVQIAIEVGSMGPQVQAAMTDLCRAGRAEVLLDLVERAPTAEAGAPVWEFLKGERVLDSLLQQPRIDMPLVTRFVKRIGIGAAPTLLAVAAVFEDAKTRAQFYDLLQSLGDDVGSTMAQRIPDAPPAMQRELLAQLGRLGALPSGFSARSYLDSEEALVRREAVRLLLRNATERDETIMSALSDPDDRVVFAGLTIAQEKCPPAGIDLIRQRVDRGELDSQLRTMGIRIVAQRHSPETLAWLLGFVATETQWARRPKLRASTPEMMAALSMIATHWRNQPSAESVLKLAEQSRDPEVRAKVARARSTTGQPS